MIFYGNDTYINSFVHVARSKETGGSITLWLFLRHEFNKIKRFESALKIISSAVDERQTEDGKNRTVYISIIIGCL